MTIHIQTLIFLPAASTKMLSALSPLFQETSCPCPDPKGSSTLLSLSSFPTLALYYLDSFTFSYFFLFSNSPMNRIPHNRVRNLTMQSKIKNPRRLPFPMELIGTKSSAYGIRGMPVSYDCLEKPVFFPPVSLF